MSTRRRKRNKPAAARASHPVETTPDAPVEASPTADGRPRTRRVFTYVLANR